MDYTKERKLLYDYYVINGDARKSAEKLKIRVYAAMDEFAAKHPDSTGFQFKAEQYRTIASMVEPVLFDGIPFYYETGALDPYCDGDSCRGMAHANGWVTEHNSRALRNVDPENTRLYEADKAEKIYFGHWNYFDDEHYKIPMKKIFRNGLRGVMEEAKEALKECESERERDFVNAALASLEAEKTMLDKFAALAEKKLGSESDPEKRKNLSLIAKTASRVPWERPESVYEGLCTLAFMRKAVGSIEGVGFNSFGRTDKLLAPLYEADIARGVKREEIYDLICRFILIWDSHVDRRRKMEGYADYEYENSLTIGGCDDDGNELFNEITRMFIEAHTELDSMFPKIACRFGAKSSEEYLRLIGSPILREKSIMLYVNDDTYIPGLLKRGISLSDARDYTISGCWGLSIDDVYKNACGYINTLKAVEWGLNPPLEKLRNQKISDFTDLRKAKDFEELYKGVLDNILLIMRRKAVLETNGVRHWSDYIPVPAYSALLLDSLKKRKDFSEGGGRYNWEVMYLAVLPDTIDSLLSMKRLCFDEKLCTLAELADECRGDWKNEELRREAMKAPGYGDGSEESARLTARLLHDLYTGSKDFPTAYGGRWELSSFMYTEIIWWGKNLGATPNGRHAGDYISQGLTPSRLHRIKSVTDVFSGLRYTDMTELSAGSVINVILPAASMNEQLLEGFFRGCAMSGTHIMQVNCVKKEELLAAMEHPEKYGHIIVRVCGFSAPFVSLSRDFQEEFISRNFYE